MTDEQKMAVYAEAAGRGVKRAALRAGRIPLAKRQKLIPDVD